MEVFLQKYICLFASFDRFDLVRLYSAVNVGSKDRSC